MLEFVLRDVRERSAEALIAEIAAAVARKRDTLLSAITIAERQLKQLEVRRQAALDALTMQYQGVSERTRAALAQHADAAVAAYDELEEQLRTLRIGIVVLDEKARTITQTLTSPNLDPARWQEPEAYLALKRALNLLTHALILREAEPGAFHVEVQLYEIRQSLLHESTRRFFRTKTILPRRLSPLRVSS